MVGDVFLCSGQSNMEFELRNSASGARAVDGSADPGLRLLTVDHATSPVAHASATIQSRWRVAGPAEVGGFAAVCYYFGRELREKKAVPIGLVQSTWSGSYIESWIGADAFRRLGGHDKALELNALYDHAPADAEAEVGRQWEAWWRAAFPNGSEPWRGDASLQWKDAPLPWRNWTKWDVPDLKSNVALVWFKRDVELTAQQAAQASHLKLAELHEQVEVWVNGKPTSATFMWGGLSDLALPASTFHAGVNTIVAGVFSGYDPGGMLGPADHMALDFADGSSQALGSGWLYAHPPSPPGRPPMAPWFFYGGTTGLYNAMIAPLGGLRLKGVLWYQGESNTGDATHYPGLLSALKESWRSEFGAKTPFLIIQLPNFGAPAATPQDSDWASLREAQRRSVEADPSSALVVTIDLGLSNDLHPPNKQPVGMRAARAIGPLAYGDASNPSGPHPLKAVREGDDVTVDFADAGGGLVAYSAGAPSAFELCGASPGSCRFAAARLAGTKIRIDAGASPDATRVRYCWGDSPICNLYDRNGLPVGPFEAPVQ
jgi:sialate O-acetylesterase